MVDVHGCAPVHTFSSLDGRLTKKRDIALWRACCLRLSRRLERLQCSPRLVSDRCVQAFAAEGEMLTSVVPLFVGAVVLVAACGDPSAQQPTPPPPEVDVVSVEQKNVPVSMEWVATLDGFVNAQIQPQVPGYVVRQSYREGSFVKKGQTLFEIDPRPFQAVLDQGRAQVIQAQAQEAKAAEDVERDRPLAEAQAIAQSQFDTEVQALAGATAAVKAAEAQVHQAELNLGFTNVQSLIDGIAGVAAVQVGNLVGPGTTLTTVSQVDPIKAIFALGESEYLRAAAAYNSLALGRTPADEKGQHLQLILSDNARYPQFGSFFSADRNVDLQTGTIRITATFPNPEGILRPGQFARVQAVIETLKGALVIPQRAVTELQGSYQVAVVGGDSKVAIRSVTVGPRIGAEWVIEKGVNPGERVVVEGLQKVKDGAPVTARPFQPASGKH
jgi:RND family efflux transporter MFP subunit